MLFKKMIRDIKRNSSQFITIFLMVAIAMLAFTGIKAYMDGMAYSADIYYKENNLEDLNVLGNNFTDKDLIDIKNINHVVDAERRFTLKATTDNSKVLGATFIKENNIGKLYIHEGEAFDVNKKGVWLDRGFAKENNIKLGDEITLTFEGVVLKENVLALVSAPDHLYDLKDDAELIPNRKEYGFCYLSAYELKELVVKSITDKVPVISPELADFMYEKEEDIPFTEVVVKVDSKENVNKVKEKIEENIKSAQAILKIEDSISYSAYQGEIDEGKTYVGAFSGLFVVISMLSVITTMTRLVKNQRVIIGTLKAMGFKDKKIIWHYISYGLFISMLGVILGLILGREFIGKFFMEMQMSFFDMPEYEVVVTKDSYIMGIVLVLCVSLVTYITTKSTLTKNAADTLRVEMPKVKANSLDITTKPIFNRMSFSTKWNVRDIFRNKLRTITAIFGVAGSCMLILCGLGILDSLSNFVKIQFEDLYNFKYKLSLEENLDEDELNKLKNKYGSSLSQTALIEITLPNGEKEANSVFVIDQDNDKIRFMDENEKFMTVDSNEGVYITSKLASTKGYKIGDNIEWHVLGDTEVFKTKIVGFNKDPQMQNMTMTKEYFETLGKNKFKPDSLYSDADLKDVKEIENVKLFQDISLIKMDMMTFLEAMTGMIVIIVVVAVVLGIVIIYNMGILSYTEKQYQFATLKVLGFKDKQIRNIFIKQNTIVSIVAVILGCPLGYLMVKLIYKFALAEAYDMIAYVKPISYLVAAIGVFIVTTIVSKILSKKINKIDMVTSLKGNE